MPTYTPHTTPDWISCTLCPQPIREFHDYALFDDGPRHIPCMADRWDEQTEEVE